jgi:subtilisin-like proprotein convertase family protein
LPLPLLFAGLIPAPPIVADELEAALEAERSRAAELAPVPERGERSLAPVGITNPLLIGVDDAAIPAELVDPTGANPDVPLPLGVQLWGAAFDVATDTVYISSGSTFHHWVVGDPAVTTIGPFTSANDGATLSMVALGMHDGVLIGGRNIGSTNTPEGLYSIDPATGVATLLEAYADPANTDIGGLDSDPVTGLLYGTNDAAANRGLVQIPLDGSGTYTLVTPYPAGETDLDGLAVGTDGRAYLIEDDSVAASGQIHVWDFGLAAYQTPIPTPWPSSETFAAGAWIYQIVVPPGCSAPALPIPDNDPNGATDTITIDPGSGFITDLDVVLQTTHTWVGDLAFTLTHVDTGTSVTIVDRPGVPTTGNGCSGDDIDVTVDDEGPDTAIESQCSNLPAIGGAAPGGDPAGPILAALDGELIAGDWTLTVRDHAAADTGTLDLWCLEATVDTMPFVADFEEGDLSEWSSTQP